MRDGNCNLLLLAFLYLLPLVPVKGQNTKEADYYSWFDAIVGVENTELYDGIIYKVQFITKNENTEFFKSPDFLTGSVLYRGQWYYRLNLKYAVYQDELLIRVPNRLGGKTAILFKDKIDTFIIDGHTFLNLMVETEEVKVSGFYEQSLENEHFILLTKHLKKNFKRKDGKKLYYEFKEGNKRYLLWYREAYYIVKNKKDITKLFPNLKKEIDTFYIVARSLRTSDPYRFMQALMNRIETLLSQEHNAETE